MATVILAVAVAALAGWIVWERRHAILEWVRRTPEAVVDSEECEVCGRRAATNVTVYSQPKARADLGGWSAISATWCVEHCPEEHRPAA